MKKMLIVLGLYLEDRIQIFKALDDLSVVFVEMDK